MSFREGDRVRFLNGDDWLTGRVIQADVPVGPGLIFRVLTDDGREMLIGLRQLIHED